MLKYLKQNKNIFIVAIGLFIASMSTLLFFLNDAPESHLQLKTDVVDSITLKSRQEEERVYRELLENHSDPIIILGLDGTIHFASWEFEANGGYRHKELKGELFFSLLHPDDLGTFMAAFGKVIETEKILTMIGPYRLRYKNGEYSVHMGSLHPLKEGEKILKLGITTRDISNEIEQKNEETESTEKAPPPTPPPPPPPPPPPTPPPPKKNPQKEPEWFIGNRLVMNFSP